MLIHSQLLMQLSLVNCDNICHHFFIHQPNKHASKNVGHLTGYGGPHHLKGRRGGRWFCYNWSLFVTLLYLFLKRVALLLYCSNGAQN